MDAMPDVFTKKKRSEVMSNIRSRGNRDTELVMARVLRALGITGWRRHIAISLGRGRSAFDAGRSVIAVRRVRPDFVFRAQKVALFVDGCFWHACPIHATQPRSHAAMPPFGARSWRATRRAIEASRGS